MRIRRPRTDRYMTSAAGGLIEQSKSAVSLGQSRFLGNLECVLYFHAVMKQSVPRGNSFNCAGCIAGFHLVTGNCCGGGYLETPLSAWARTQLGRMGSIVRLGLLISGNIHLSCHFIDSNDYVHVVFRCKVLRSLSSVHPPGLRLAWRGLLQP